MQYKLTKLLNFNAKENISIKQAIDKYFELYEIALTELKQSLDNAVANNTVFEYPQGNLQLYKEIHSLTIAGFLLCYEITNNDMFTIYCQQFIDNKKLVTPDVFFYIIVVLNEVITKTNQYDWSDKFHRLINEIDVVSNVPSAHFQANLAQLKDLGNNIKRKRATTATTKSTTKKTTTTKSTTKKVVTKSTAKKTTKRGEK